MCSSSLSVFTLAWHIRQRLFAVLRVVNALVLCQLSYRRGALQRDVDLPLVADGSLYCKIKILGIGIKVKNIWTLCINKTSSALGLLCLHAKQPNSQPFLACQRVQSLNSLCGSLLDYSTTSHFLFFFNKCDSNPLEPWISFFFSHHLLCADVCDLPLN